MPKNAGEFFNKLATKAGMKVDDDAMKAFLAIPELSKIEVPDTISDGIEGGLYTLDAARAKIGPEERTKFKAEAYNGIDAELNAYLVENGADADLIEAVKAEKSTAARFKKAIQAREDALTKKLSTGKIDVAEYTKQINDLKREKSDLQKTMDDKVAKLQADFENEMTTAMVRTDLAGYNYVQDKIDKNINVLTSLTLLNQELEKDQAVVRYDKTTGQKKLVKKDGTDFYDKTNNPVQFKQYVDGLLAKNNLIQVSGAQPPNKTGTQPAPVIVPGDPSAAQSAKLISSIDAEIAALSK